MSSSIMLSPPPAEPPSPSLSSSSPPMPSPPSQGADQPPDAAPARDDSPPSSSPAQSPSPVTSSPSLSSPPLVTVALVPQVHCLWSSRYSSIMPAALTDCLLPSEFSASIRRINAVVGCPSWAVTVYLLCLAFTLSGIVLVVVGTETTVDSGNGNSIGNSTVPPSQQPSVTATLQPTSTLPVHHEVIATALWVGVAFLVFGCMLSGCCRRRFRLSQLRELHHAVIIENTLYARSVPRITWRVGPQLGWWERKRAMMRQRRRVHSHQIIIQVGGATTAGADDGQQQQQMFVASLHNTAVPSIRRREGDPLFAMSRWRSPAVDKQLERDAGVVMRLATVPDTAGDDEQAEVKDGGVGAPAREPSVSRLPPAYEEDNEAQHVAIEMMPMQHRAEGEAGSSPRAADAAERSEGRQHEPEILQGEGKGEALQTATATGDSPVLVLSPAAEDEKEQLEYEAVVAELLREKEEQEAKLRRIAQQLEDIKRRKQKLQPSGAAATAEKTPEPAALSIILSPPFADAGAGAGISFSTVPSQPTGETGADTGPPPAFSSSSSSPSSSSSSSIPAAALLHLPVPMSGTDGADDGVSSGRSERSGSVVMLDNRRFSI